MDKPAKSLTHGQTYGYLPTLTASLSIRWYNCLVSGAQQCECRSPLQPSRYK